MTSPLTPGSRRIFYPTVADHVDKYRYNARVPETAVNTLPAVIAGEWQPLYEVTPEIEILSDSALTINELMRLNSAKISWALVDYYDWIEIAHYLDAYINETYEKFSGLPEYRKYLAMMNPFRKEVIRNACVVISKDDNLKTIYEREIPGIDRIIAMITKKDFSVRDIFDFYRIDKLMGSMETAKQRMAATNEEITSRAQAAQVDQRGNPIPEATNRDVYGRTYFGRT